MRQSEFHYVVFQGQIFRFTPTQWIKFLLHLTEGRGKLKDIFNFGRFVGYSNGEIDGWSLEKFKGELHLAIMFKR